MKFSATETILFFCHRKEITWEADTGIHCLCVYVYMYVIVFCMHICICTSVLSCRDKLNYIPVSYTEYWKPKFTTTVRDTSSQLGGPNWQTICDINETWLRAASALYNAIHADFVSPNMGDNSIKLFFPVECFS